MILIWESMNSLTASCYWLITGAELAVVLQADAKKFFQMEARVKHVRRHLEREGPCCADAHYKNDRNIKLEKRYMVNGIVHWVSCCWLPKSALCTAACSLLIKPRVRIYFYISGFSWAFFWVTVYFAAQGLARFCTHVNVIFPRAVANRERFGVLHYTAPCTPLYFAQELKWQTGGFMQWIGGIAPHGVKEHVS